MQGVEARGGAGGWRVVCCVQDLSPFVVARQRTPLTGEHSPLTIELAETIVGSLPSVRTGGFSAFQGLISLLPLSSYLQQETPSPERSDNGVCMTRFEQAAIVI